MSDQGSNPTSTAADDEVGAIRALSPRTRFLFQPEQQGTAARFWLVPLTIEQSAAVMTLLQTRDIGRAFLVAVRFGLDGWEGFEYVDEAGVAHAAPFAKERTIVEGVPGDYATIASLNHLGPRLFLQIANRIQRGNTLGEAEKKS